MRRWSGAVTAVIAALTTVDSARGQTVGSDSVILRQIREEGFERSRVAALAQVLLDSIGPRITGSPRQQSAASWVMSTYQSWGVPVRAENYGSWKAWRRGILHVDLLSPQVRSLEGTLMIWSAGTRGPVTGRAIVLPSFRDTVELAEWLPQARNAFVLLAYPEPSCRPDESWKQHATRESFERMQNQRAASRQALSAKIRLPGLSVGDLLRRIENARPQAVIVSLPTSGWGTYKVGTAIMQKIPELALTCEDYGLVHRLAANSQNPVLRLQADANFEGEVPVANVIAEMRGSTLPGEYVVLSAHSDTWDAGSGATDNGAGTVVMMEASRILRKVYPTPKRTILVGHWNGEEQGLNGSRAFAADHPEVVNGLQALFNQDNGTGRVDSISMQGLTEAAAFFRRWLAGMPAEMTRHLTIVDPGSPDGGTDHASFICHGAPAFNLGSVGWDYEAYTWHTNRDSYDKLVIDDLKSTATLVAMLAYLASEDPQRIPRVPRVTRIEPRTGQSVPWPKCDSPARKSQ